MDPLLFFVCFYPDGRLGLIPSTPIAVVVVVVVI